LNTRQTHTLGKQKINVQQATLKTKDGLVNRFWVVRAYPDRLKGA